MQFYEFFEEVFIHMNKKQFEQFKFIRGMNDTLFEHNMIIKNLLLENYSGVV